MNARSLLLLLLVALPLASAAAPPIHCSLPVSRPVAAAELEAMAKFSKKDAETIALANLARKPLGPGVGKLAVDKGCVVWSFEFKRDKKGSLVQVLVDAGNGQFLWERIERPKAATAGTSRKN